MKEQREALVVERDGGGFEGGGKRGVQTKHSVIVGVAVDVSPFDRLEYLRRGHEFLRTGDERVGGDRLFDELLASLEIARFQKFPGDAKPAVRLLSTWTDAASVGIHIGFGF